MGRILLQLLPMRRDPFAEFNIRRATQLVTKSDQWFDDVQFLYGSRRYAAALYLGGFVIECLLKARLWPRRFEPKIRPLLFSHRLGELLKADVNLSSALKSDPHAPYEQFVHLSTWTVRVRYNPRGIDPQDAAGFLRRLREVRLWLRDRIRG